MRAARYTFDSEDYFRRANDNILVLFILETREMVEDLEAIAAIRGVDGLYVGEYDLSLSLGLNPMNLPLAQVDAVVDRLLDVARRTGVAAGIGVEQPGPTTPSTKSRIQAAGIRA